MTSPGHDERHQSNSGIPPERDLLGIVSRRGGGRERTPEERLEALLAERRRELEEHARRLEETVSSIERREELVGDARASVERVLRLGAADLEAREAELADHAHGLDVREQQLREGEARLARRRSELGAVELKRAAVEQREQAVAAREDELAAREQELAARESVQDAVDERADEADLLFVPGPSYRLVEGEHGALARGASVEVDDEEYVVVRLGPSPLPGDDRRCAYLVRGPRRESPPDGSS